MRSGVQTSTVSLTTSIFIPGSRKHHDKVRVATSAAAALTALAALAAPGVTAASTATARDDGVRAFYVIAGAAIFYVIAEITSGMRRLGYRELGFVLVAGGFGPACGPISSSSSTAAAERAPGA